MAFANDTFVCLDLPEPIASEILAIRRRHRDTFRSALPAEITIAGSSGNGPLAAGQDPNAVLQTIEAIVAETEPIRTAFASVVRFPATDIFALTLQNESGLRALHDRIATSGIAFRSSPFPFSPHCTLRSRLSVEVDEGGRGDPIRIRLRRG